MSSSSSSSDSESDARNSAPHSHSEHNSGSSSDSSNDNGTDAAPAASLSKGALRRAAAKARAAEGQSEEHIAAQLVVLNQLLSEKSSRDPRFRSPDLAGKDRKFLNQLEKKLRKELGWPRADGTPFPAKLSKAEKAKQKAEKAAATEARTRLKLAQHLAAGVLPENLKDLATALSQKGRNPFNTEDPAATAAAASAAAGTLEPLTPMELHWTKTHLKNERRAAKAAEEDLRTKKQNREKRKQTSERYRLPPEMHIPQELVIANPEANALRLEKESKLYKYKRNAPNYAELVAKVREEFLNALPAATGAGGVSGADGNVNSAKSGWDRRTKFVAEFTEADEEAAVAAAAAAAEAAKRARAALAESEEQPRKKSKKGTDGESAAAAAAAAAPPLPLLHESYHPRFVSSFSWLPEQSDLRKASIDPLNPSSVLSYTASRMVQPGAPYSYLRPSLPLVFRPNQKGFAVDKPDIVALIMAARVAGITFEHGKTSKAEEAAASAEAASGEIADDESEDEEAKRKLAKKMKKEKKQREKEGKSLDADGDESMAASSSSSSSSTPLRFVSYRNNFRKFFNRKEFWRVDLQRVGNTIFLRRYLNYNYVNPFDVGHLFEQACKADNVIAAMAEANGVSDVVTTKYAAAGFAKKEGLKLRDLAAAHKEDSTTHPYRAIVHTKLREFELVTSIEIDLCQKDPSSAAAADPSDPLSTFLELKTVPKHRWTLQKKADVWVQTFLGGVPRTIVGLKEDHKELDEKAKKKMRKEERRVALMNNEEYAYDTLKKKKASKRAGNSAIAQLNSQAPPAVQVSEILEARTEHLIDPVAKEKLMAKFYAMLQFVARNVKEGRVYKLEHRKKEENAATAAAAASNGKSVPFVHPSRTAGSSASAPSRDHAHNAQNSHMENWEILLEELPEGMEAQPVIVPGVLEQVDAWAEMRKIQTAQESAERAKAEAEAATLKAEKKSEKKSKKKSSKKEKDGGKVKDEKDSGKASKKKKSKRKERDAGADAATDGESGSTKKKKKARKDTDASTSAAAAAASATGEPADSEKKKKSKKSKSDKKSSKSEKKSKKDKDKDKTRKGTKRKEMAEESATTSAAPAAVVKGEPVGAVVKKERAAAAAASDSSSDSD